MAELKKCPFCGGEVKIIAEQIDARTVAYEFRCQNLDCCSITSFDYCDREEAIEAWNNRTTETDIRAKAIDEFAEKLKRYMENTEQSNYLDEINKGNCNYSAMPVYDAVDEIAEQLKEE